MSGRFQRSKVTGILGNGALLPASLVHYDADLSAPLSTASNQAAIAAVLSAKSLTLTRSSSTGATIQTSDAAIVAGLGVDVGRIGWTSHGNGLAIEQRRTNLLSFATSGTNLTPTGVGAAAPVDNGNGATGPDGSSASKSFSFPAASSSGDITVVYEGITATAAKYTASVWLRGTVGGEQLYIMIVKTGGTGFVSRRVTLTTSWQRFDVSATCDAASWFLQIGIDKRDGTQTSIAACTINVAYAQFELGGGPSEAIPTAAAAVTREQDHLRYVGTTLGSNSGLAMEYTFVAKESATDMCSVTPRIFLPTGASGVEVRFETSRKINFAPFGGPTGGGQSSGTVSWSAGDLVRLFFDVGGSRTTRAYYEVNSGGMTNIDAGASLTPVGAITSGMANDAYLCSWSDDVSNRAFACYLQRLRGITSGAGPL